MMQFRKDNGPCTHGPNISHGNSNHNVKLYIVKISNSCRIITRNIQHLKCTTITTITPDKYFNNVECRKVTNRS